MPTALQSETARINGTKSQGPVTLEGKARSSQNATKHGIYASNIVLANESQEQYLLLRDAWLRRLRPADDAELDLVEEIVACRWRLRRIWNNETAGIDIQVLKREEFIAQTCVTIDEPSRVTIAVNDLIDTSRTLATFRRLETALSRQFQRALETLRQLQAERRNQKEPAEPRTQPIPVFDNFRNKPGDELPKPAQPVTPAEDPPADQAA